MNALLGEEAILPTSGMRACTAVVVEVSFNQDNTDFEGEVEFLSQQEWHSKLELLLKDVMTDDGKLTRLIFQS